MQFNDLTGVGVRIYMINNRRYIELSKVSNAALLKNLPQEGAIFLRKSGMGQTEKGFKKYAELWKAKQRILLINNPSTAVLFTNEKAASK